MIMISQQEPSLKQDLSVGGHRPLNTFSGFQNFSQSHLEISYLIRFAFQIALKEKLLQIR